MATPAGDSIGEAVITVGADASNFGDDLKGKVEGQAPGIGKRISSGIGTALKAGIAVVGVAAGAALGKSLFGGFNRLADIDQAKKKLEGLGHSGATIDTIMKNALASVKGTAFGLDEAATISANLVAAGIKPGNQLEQALRAVANTASVAGTSMSGVSDVFTEVAAMGKVTGDTLMRLETRGIPATQLLAEALGKTREETRKMVSEGAIDFQTFAGVIDETMGSAALVAGDSFRGMLSNIGASMNRFGAVLLGPAFEGLKTLMPSVIAFFDRLTVAIQPLVDALAPKVAAFFSNFAGFLDGVDFEGFSLKFEDLPGLFLTVMGSVQEALLMGIQKLPGILTSIIPQMAAAFTSKATLLLGAITNVVGGLAEGIAAVLPGLVGQFARFLPILVTALTNMIPRLVESIIMVVTTIIGILPTLLPALINGALALFMGLVQGLTTVIPVLIQSVTALLPVIIETLLASVGTLLEAAATLFSALIDGLITILPTLIDTAISTVLSVMETVVSMLPDLVDAAIELFMALVEGLIEVSPVLFDAIFDMLPDILESIIRMLPMLIDAAVKLFYGLIIALVEILPQLIESVISMGPRLARTIGTLVPLILEAAFTLFLAIVDAVFKMVPDLIKAVIGLGPKLVNSLVKMAPDLRQAGRDMLWGLINGIKDMAGRVWQAAKDVASNVGNSIKGFFGIGSPSKLMKGYGKNIGEGLVIGMAGMARQVGTAVDDMLSKVPSETSMSIRGPEAGRTLGMSIPARSDAQVAAAAIQGIASTSSTLGPVYVNLTVPMDDLRQLKDLEDFMEMLQVRARMGSERSEN